MSNKMAWILAGIFGAFMVIVIVKVAFFPSPTDPTSATIGPGKLTLQSPVKPVTLVLPSVPGGAGDDYHTAIQLYKQNRPAIEEVCAHAGEVRDGKYRLSAADSQLLKPIQDALSAGAARKGMTYSFRHTPKTIEIPYEATEAGDFQDVANVPFILSENHIAAGKDSYPQGEKCIFDMFTMGHHMIGERARLDTVLFGVGLQKNACDLLMRLYAIKWDRTDRFKQIKEYKDGLDRLSSIYGEHQRNVIWHLPPHPGDVANLVANHADRAVRVEALLGLGVAKLTCTKRGDRSHIAGLIARKLGSADEIERAAARCANSLDQGGLTRLINP